MTSKKRSHSLARAVLAILFVISCFQWVRNTRDGVNYILHRETLALSPFDVDNVTNQVESVTPEAAAAGLQKGDAVLSIQGHPFEGLTDLYGAMRNAKLGDQLRLHVRSSTTAGPVEKDISIELNQPFTYLGMTKAGSHAFSWIILPSILLPLFCIVLGFWVAFARIGDESAWLLLLLLLGIAFTITEGRTLFGNQDAIQPFLTGFVFGFRALTPLAVAFFGILFPDRLAFDRGFPWAKWIVFAPVMADTVLTAAVTALLLHHQDKARLLWPARQFFFESTVSSLPLHFSFSAGF